MKKRPAQFEKFAPKKSNAAIKEHFRQEKRKLKKEREEYFDEKKRQERSQKAVGGRKPEVGGKKFEDRGPKSEVRGQRSEGRSRKSEVRSQRPDGGNREVGIRKSEDRGQGERGRKSEVRSPRSEGGSRKPGVGERKFEDRGQRSERGGQRSEDRSRKSEVKSQRPEDGRRRPDGGNREVGGRKFEDRGRKTEDGSRKSEVRSQRPEAGSRKQEGRGQRSEDRSRKSEVRSQRPEDGRRRPEGGGRNAEAENNQGRRQRTEAGSRKTENTSAPDADAMPLNKYIAHCGVCSRRDAAELIREGKVKVNNETVTEPGHKVSFRDEIKLNGKKLFIAKDLVYILLNKPKDYITTTDDPQNRKTVLDLIRRATDTRVYPVGRLDRNTSGVLLLTNDGELAQKLTHPSHEIKKVYAVTLDKPLEKAHFDQILKGVTLEDGPASVDVLAYADIKDKTQIGVEIHSGRNRIVRRIFEHLGYDVKNLDRVTFAGLTKKNVERGKWRFLTEKEIRDLKYFRKGK